MTYRLVLAAVLAVAAGSACARPAAIDHAPLPRDAQRLEWWYDEVPTLDEIGATQEAQVWTGVGNRQDWQEPPRVASPEPGTLRLTGTWNNGCDQDVVRARYRLEDGTLKVLLDRKPPRLDCDPYYLPAAPYQRGFRATDLASYHVQLTGLPAGEYEVQVFERVDRQVRVTPIARGLVAVR